MRFSRPRSTTDAPMGGSNFHGSGAWLSARVQRLASLMMAGSHFAGSREHESPLVQEGRPVLGTSTRISDIYIYIYGMIKSRTGPLGWLGEAGGRRFGVLSMNAPPSPRGVRHYYSLAV